MTGAWDAVLLAAAPGIPLLLALVRAVPGARRLVLALAPWAAVPALGVALARWPSPVAGPVPLPLVGGFRLALDPTGHAFLVLTAGIWVAAGAFARRYHAEDPHRSSFFGWFLLTLAGNLGLVVAHDAVGFYVFFAVMTFSAWGLVIHERTGPAFRAGRIYIVMAVLGDLAILAALFALGTVNGSPGFGAELDRAWNGLGSGAGGALTAALLLAGFGVKAGLIPLHVWLPVAYREAPVTATAVLSGAMMKAGVLAWIRFLPHELAFPVVGAGLVGLGILAALYGVIIGLTQRDATTVLAYSSVSQIGFMALPVGVMVYDARMTAVGIAAVTVYVLHHGLAKGALFLAIGVTDRGRGTTGTGWRTAVLLGAALPALAVAGAPLTTGAMAKGTLGTAFERLGGGWYHVLHPVLLVAALGTTLLLGRFLLLLAARARDGADSRGAPAALPLLVPWALLILAGGLGPLWIPGLVSSPALEPSGPAATPVESLLPVLAGAALTWVASRRPGLLGPLARVRIPPGDVLIPLGAGWDRLRRGVEASLRFGARAGRAMGGGWRAQTERAERGARWLADRDLRLMQGGVIGGMIALIAALLVLALQA